jgi:hypothetical protein
MNVNSVKQSWNSGPAADNDRRVIAVVINDRCRGRKSRDENRCNAYVPTPLKKRPILYIAYQPSVETKPVS